VVDWLRQLFELPAEFGGVLTTGATMANFVALAAARNWWGNSSRSMWTPRALSAYGRG
jgi:glutamate/tyrosine decarboxylase-like PLP-dependent enzyme